MPGTIDLSSVIAGMNQAAGSTMSGARSIAGATMSEGNKLLNQTMAEAEAESKKELDTVKKPGKGKAAWDEQTTKPLASYIKDNMATPDLAAQDSLLSMLSMDQQKYAVATYNVVARGNA